MKIGFGLGLSDYRLKGGYSPSPEAAAWKANIISNGGSVDPAVLQVFDEEFFIPAAANGNILSEADRIHIWITNSNNIAARTSVVNNYFATFVNSPIFDDNGVKSDGVSAYVNLNYNPNSNGVKFQLNNCSVGYIANVTTYSGTIRGIGGIDLGTFSRCDLYRQGNVNSAAFVNTLNAVVNTNIVTGSNIMFVGHKDNATDLESIINNNVVSGLEASANIPNAISYELSTNVGGPIGDYDTDYHITSWHGSSSFDYNTFKTLITNLKLALAAL